MNRRRKWGQPAGRAGRVAPKRAREGAEPGGATGSFGGTGTNTGRGYLCGAVSGRSGRATEVLRGIERDQTIYFMTEWDMEEIVYKFTGDPWVQSHKSCAVVL